MDKDLKLYKEIIDNGLCDIYNNGHALLKAPINYIIHGGKRLRPILCILSNDACGGSLEKVLPPAISIELLHIFSLVHDDIMDDDSIRHNKETIHSKWNIPIGILSGDAILALALKELNMSSDLIRKKFNNALIAICEGQAFDIEYQSVDDITLDQYFYMISLKTSYMLGLSAEIGAMVAGAEKKVSDLFNQIGLLLGKAFQLQDDLLEITSTEQKMGKSLNSDVLLNKKTYLLIEAKTKYPDEIKSIYSKKQTSSSLNMHVKNFLIDSGIVDDCKRQIDIIFDEVYKCINDLNIDKSKLTLYVNKLRNRIF